MINNATLPILLKQLRLATIRENWKDVAIQAEKNHWTYSQYLTALCDREMAGREQNRIERNIKEARLPIGKTLDTFNFDKLPSINAPQISAFADNTHWVTNAQNLIIFGPSGVGKTHLAAAIGRRLSERGMRVLFTKTTSLMQQLQLAYSNHKLSDLLVKLAKYDLLILDDIGYVKKSEAETSVLFELIADRYEAKSILITSNQSFDQWETIFPSSVMAVAAIDRLIHHSTIININEQSYRRTSKMNQNKSV